MADLTFSREDIENLAQRLSALARDLTSQEHDLLLAIFAAAADRATPARSGEATLPLASSGQAPGTGEQESVADLKQQLLTAFIPGNSFDSVTEPRTPPVETPPPGSIHP